MTRRGSRLRQVGWMVAIGACIALFIALAFRVNAIKSEVKLAEREIVALERSTLMLETEFAARASQQQLADWNMLEFGYAAPAADQFLENERQLVSLGTPRGIDAPEPIRVARSLDIPAKEDVRSASPVNNHAQSIEQPKRPSSPGTVKANADDVKNTRTTPMRDDRPLAERLAFAEAFPSAQSIIDQSSAQESSQ